MQRLVLLEESKLHYGQLTSAEMFLPLQQTLLAHTLYLPSSLSLSVCVHMRACVCHSSSHVRNSHSFCEFIQPQVLQEGEVLASFNMVSLFTNVPMDLALAVAQQWLQEDSALSDRTCLSVKEVMELIEFCLSTTFLGFCGMVYRQTFGTAMGSPVSVTVANLVMEDVEQRALATTDVHPQFWKRYVDDACTVLPADDVQKFLDHLNGVEQSICFTVEVESDGKLPFLDVLLRHNPDSSVSTTVYRKPSHTDRYLDFPSHHPLAYKVAVVRTLHSRAETINSSVVGKDEETRHLRQVLTANSYPKGMIQSHSMVRSTRPVGQDDTQGPAITLPYVRVVSEAVRHILAPVSVRVSFRPHTILRQLLTRPKDRVPEKELSGVVYQVPCAGCPATYVGQTGRRLDQRLTEHRRAMKSGQAATSALAEHAWGAHHPVDWDNVKVLDHQPHLHQRLRIYIRSQVRPLNRDKGSMLYNSLFSN